MKKKIDIKDFIKLHKKFSKEKNWNKKKKEYHEDLYTYLNNCSGEITIKSNRDSQTTKVHLKNEFTFFKVNNLQKGKLLPYRGKLVMMICMDRRKFNHLLKVYPLDINEEQIKLTIMIENLKQYTLFHDFANNII
jgi:hypothetical protein